MLSIPFTGESRIQLIQAALEKTQAKSYLEIGCDRDKVWKRIDCKNKVGVDPVRGGNCRMTSDKFFSLNTEMFDVVFIDGLHYYDQVSRDLNNSLKFLNDHGIIILHDMLPSTPGEAIVPIPDPLPRSWLGDVWRLAFDLAARDDITFKLVLIDNGCGVVFKKPQTPKKLTVVNDWDFYQSNWKELPLTTYEEISNDLK